MEHTEKLIEKCEQVNIRIPLDEVHLQIANRVFEETAAVVKCNRTASTAKGGKRRLKKSTKRQSTRRQARKTKRRVKGRTAKRQTKRRQRK